MKALPDLRTINTAQTLHLPTSRLFVLAFALLGWCIFLYVIFPQPMMGMMDQNDFWRLQYGMENMDEEHFNSVEKFRYAITEFRFTPFPHGSLVFSPMEYTPIYFIYAARMLCKLLGYETFQMSVLCLLSGGVYIGLLTAVYALLLPGGNGKRLLLGGVMLFVFCDGTYLLWFNSLYAEGYGLIGLLMTAAAFILCCKRIQTLPFWSIGLLLLGCIFLLGTKTQMAVLCPVCMVLMGSLWFMSRKNAPHSRSYVVKSVCICVSLLIMVFFTVGLYNSKGDEFTKETLYHSTFLGLLMDAEDPASVLRDWGVDPALAADVGKHSYLPPADYAFASPFSEIMETEFFAKVGRDTVIRYYVTHPKALWSAMSYTAAHALRTDTGLRTHTESYTGKTPDKARFSLYSSLRNRLPKALWFLLVVCAAGLLCLIHWCRRAKGKAGEHNNPHPLCSCLLFAGVLLSAILQFALPYTLNGRADVQKQLFTFHYLFDVVCVVLAGCAVLAGGRFLPIGTGDRTGDDGLRR